MSGWLHGLRKSEAETPRARAGSASSGDGARLLRWTFTNELEASSSLNSRGSTLAGLIAATIAIVGTFTAAWLDGDSGVSGIGDWILVALLVLSLLALGGSAGYAIAAVWPRSRWRGEVGEMIAMAAAKPSEQEEASLLLSMAEHQRATNETKARRMRLSYLLLAAGLVLVIAQPVALAIGRAGDDSAGARVALTLRGASSGGVELDLLEGDDGAGVSVADDSDSQIDDPDWHEEMARKFTPIVWLHSAERYGPMSPDAFLEASSLRWRKRFRDGRVAVQGGVDKARLGVGCDTREPSCYQWGAHRADQLTRPFHSSALRSVGLKSGHGFYLDVDDSLRKGDDGEVPGVPMLYETRSVGSELRITYWFFYGFSRPYAPFVGGNIAGKLSHEGDWENIDVAIDAEGRPLSVAFYGHGDPHVEAWSDVCKEIDGRESCSSSEPGRPVVFSARESHASYAKPVDRKGKATAVCGRHLGIRVCSHDFRNRGTRWDPAERPASLLDARAQPWYGFGGAWGTVGVARDMTGPLGPSAYKLPDDPNPGELALVAP